MKKIVRIGLLLVLVAFLHNLINVFVRAEYWEEPGAAQNTVQLYTTFGDWEYFYYEDFETTRWGGGPGGEGDPSFFPMRPIHNGSATFYYNHGMRLKDNTISGRSVYVDDYIFELGFEPKQGLGGFSFEYKKIRQIPAEANGQLKLSFWAINKGENRHEKEPTEILHYTGNMGEVNFVRLDFDVPETQYIYIEFVGVAGGGFAIDNVKWSDHDIKLEFRDGYGENKLYQSNYIRYGRKAPDIINYVENNLLEGYENYEWYTDPSLSAEYLFDKNSPIREDTTLYLDRDLIVYEIEYDLKGGYFEPYDNRDELIVGFLTDLYNYLDSTDKLHGAFHERLKAEGLANDTITLDDFIYGVGRSGLNPKTLIDQKGQEIVHYDGLFLKGFVVQSGEVGDEIPISFDLNGGIFANIGGTVYTNNNTMRIDFLTDFHTFLTNHYGYTKSVNDFIHGVGKTSGFDGEYDIKANFDRLYTRNNKNVNASLGTFVNQPEYNKWVPLIDLMDEYTRVGNPAQNFWGDQFVARYRIKPFIQKKNLWAGQGEPKASQIMQIVNRIPQNIFQGGTPQEVPGTFVVGTGTSLPTPTKLGATFNGWYEAIYTYQMVDGERKKVFSGWSDRIYQIDENRTETVYLYAKWGTHLPTAKSYDELPKMLSDDCFFKKIYMMDDNWLVEEFNLDLRLSNTERIKKGLEPIDYFINQPEYNKWVSYIDLIHEYTAYGNPAQAWHGIWKSYYTGIIRMDMFLRQYNPWYRSQYSERQYTVYEMLRRVPYDIPKELIPYSYTIESDPIILPLAVKEHASLTGWYTDPNFDPNTKVDVIPTGSTGNKKFYSLYNEMKYRINYDLDAGAFAPYTNRDQLINDFLDDFYDFVKLKLNDSFSITRSQFKHGAGNTSGFNGEYTNYIYFDDVIAALPIQLLFATNNRTIDPQTQKFINQEYYNLRWLPLLDMAADFTRDANASEDFWDSPKIAADRLKQLFRRIRPSGSDPAKVDKYFTMIPADIPEVVVPHYYIKDVDTPLPIPVKDGYRFVGWEDLKTSNLIPNNIIPAGTAEDIDIKARWIQEGIYEVTYYFGEYGYQGITHTELFLLFINNYLDRFSFPPAYTEDRLYNDFFNNSALAYTTDEIDEIFSYFSDRWKWLREYIEEIAKPENYGYAHEDLLGDDDEEIWRLNFDAFFNSRRSSFTKIVEGVEITYYSIDFSSLNYANSFWSLTTYNQAGPTALIPGGELFPEEFINCWHPGYKFAGWYDNEHHLGSRLLTLPAVPNGDLELYAKWVLAEGFKDIIVTFIDYDDTVIEVRTFDLGEEITPPDTDPVREHYTFTGWDKDLSTITSSTIVQAVYEGHTYTLEFETYAGGTDIPPQTLVYPETPTEPADPTRAGYTFDGWYSSEEFTEEFFFIFPLYGVNDGDVIKVYAKWDPNIYNITYVLEDGATNHESNPTTYTNLDVLPLYPAEKENHTFGGWYLNAEHTGSPLTIIENRHGDLTLYAKFEMFKYQVTFDSDGGTVVPIQMIEHGNTATKPDNPVKFGFVFNNWLLNGEVFDFGTLIYQDIILVADYSVAVYKVKFHDDQGTVINEQDIVHDEYASVPAVPDKSVNPGAYTKSWDPHLVNVKIQQDYDVHPLYTEIEYNIIYHLDGGTNHINNPNKYSILSVIALSNATKLGYEFVGWYLEPEFTNKIETIENRYGDLHLYANFALETYLINYILDDGVNHSSNPATYTIHDIVILENATKEGFEFLGWYLEETFTNKIEVISNRTGVLNLYARYSAPVVYDIYYVLYASEHDPNDPITFVPTTVTYTTSTGATLDVPNHRVSSTFAGWYNNPSLTGEAVSSIPVGSTGHKTFYAKWQLRMYQMDFYNSKEDLLDNKTPIITRTNIAHSSIINLPEYTGTIPAGKEFIGWHYLVTGVEILFEVDQQVNNNFKLFPKFGTKKYTVTFYNELVVYDYREVYHGNTIPNLPVGPVPATGTFEYWQLEDGTIFDESSVVTSNLTVLAKFSGAATGHLVIFEYINASEVVVQVPVHTNNDYLEAIDIPTVPARAGYTFNYWTSNGDTYTSAELLTVLIDKNYTFVANYTINTYTIRFYNESELLETTTTTHGNNAIYTKATPVRENHIFTGWDKPLTNIQANTDFYAEFAANEYIVRFYADGVLIGEETVTHGANATAPSVPTKDHYTHTGWDQPLTNITNHISINAIYTGNTYTLTFNSNGGSAIAPQARVYPTKTNRPADPTRAGHNFVGWYTQLSGGVEYEFNQSLTGNITIYARWETQSVIVTFDVQGGTPAPDAQTITYNTQATEPTAPTKPGYVFSGWYLSNVLFEFTTTNVTSDITLVAKYTEEELTVIYRNDDNSIIETIYVSYGNTITVPALPASRAGYSLAWSENLTNVQIYEDKDVIAVYTAIVYTINYYNLVNGMTHTNKTSYTINDATFNLTAPTNLPAGTTFAGWYDNPGLNGDAVTSVPNGSTGNKAFYAKLDVTTYTIQYVLDGGQFVSYANRDEMIVAFLTDFWTFLGQPGTLTDFMHGVGKTSGFDGLYNDTDYFAALYQVNDKRVYPSTGKFINQEEYNRWVPLLDLMETYTNFNPEQTFWGSTWTGRYRIKPFIQHRNLWTDMGVTNEQVYAVTSKIPEALLSVPVVYEYNINTPTIELITPHKLHHTFVGWYTAATGGVKVTAIPQGSVGNKVFYARWSVPTYTISYYLNGGDFENYTTKEDMLDGFFQDLYDFLSPTETYEQFKGGVWYSKEAYKSKIYNGTKPTSNNEAYFISAAKYRVKWAPFFDMMDRFVKVNPDQSFWGGTYVGLIRLDQYVRDVKPGPAWTETHLRMMPTTGIVINEPTTYKAGVRTIVLPMPVRDDYAFEGWYTNAAFSGSPVTRITTSETGNKSFYAKWRPLVGFNDFEKRVMRQSLTYYNNTKNPPAAGHPRQITKGVIIITTTMMGRNADYMYNYLNRMDASLVSTHAVVDNTKTLQLLEWDFRGYHTPNIGNSEYAAVMLCENSGYYYNGNTIINYNPVAQAPYFNAVWERAVAITVFILRFYGIKVVNEYTVVGRHEAVGIGIALPAHAKANPGVLFAAQGKTMVDFRDDVRARL